MKNTIFYFSGTGNSLSVAQSLAKKLNNAEVISISKALHNDSEILFSSDKVGIVYPVYVWGVPPIIRRFIKKISRQSKYNYFFAVATNHSELAGSLLVLSNKLKSKGIELSAGFSINMPNSYTVFQKKATDEYSEDNLSTALKGAEKRAAEIASLVNNESKHGIEKGSFKQRIVNTGIIYNMTYLIYRWLDIPFKTDSNCVSCGLCKNICPMGNIELKNGKPIWKHKCEYCFRCLNSCPKHSIQYLNATSGKVRYINPSIKINNLIEK